MYQDVSTVLLSCFHNYVQEKDKDKKDKKKEEELKPVVEKETPMSDPSESSGCVVS